MEDKKVELPITKKTGEKKWLLWSLIGFTGILLATAVVLFWQLKKPVEKPSPSVTPKETEVKQTETEAVCEIAFLLTEPSPSPSVSPSPSPSVSPSPSPSVSPSPSPDLVCFDTCEDDNDCPSDLYCMQVSGDYRCVNASCPDETDCSCPSASVSPTPSSSSELIAYASPSPRVEQPELPEAGVSAPAVLGVSAGILLMLLGLLF